MSKTFKGSIDMLPEAASVDNYLQTQSNKKVAVVVNGGLVVKKGVAAEGIIEISPDHSVKEIQMEEKPENHRRGSSSSKKVQTLSSVLTDRSKVACGLTDDKPKDLVVDIDAADLDSQLAVVEYVEDLYKFYKLAENSSWAHDYMDTQPEIDIRFRAVLVDWLIEVHDEFELMPETLYLTIYIIDRFLSIKTVTWGELQLLGIGAMLIASKYEDNICAPKVNDLVNRCVVDKPYSGVQVLAMEKMILDNLEWTLTVPTPYVFLVRFIKAAAAAAATSVSDQTEMENMVFFLAELGLLHYHTTIKYCPSMLAAAAVYAARYTLAKTPVWTETLKLHTGFSKPQLMDCVKLLVRLHTKYGVPESKLKIIHRKYGKPERGSVALISPARNLLLEITGSTQNLNEAVRQRSSHLTSQKPLGLMIH